MSLQLKFYSSPSATVLLSSNFFCYNIRNGVQHSLKTRLQSILKVKNQNNNKTTSDQIF